MERRPERLPSIPGDSPPRSTESVMYSLIANPTSLSVALWLLWVAAASHAQGPQGETPPHRATVDTSAILDAYLRGRHAMTGERPILVECHQTTFLPRVPAPTIKALVRDRIIARFELTCDTKLPTETRSGIRRALGIVSITQDSRGRSSNRSSTPASVPVSVNAPCCAGHLHGSSGNSGSPTQGEGSVL